MLVLFPSIAFYHRYLSIISNVILGTFLCLSVWIPICFSSFSWAAIFLSLISSKSRFLINCSSSYWLMSAWAGVKLACCAISSITSTDLWIALSRLFLTEPQLYLNFFCFEGCSRNAIKSWSAWLPFNSRRVEIDFFLS